MTRDFAPFVEVVGTPAAAPGHASALGVRIRNDSEHSCAFLVSVLGLGASWVAAPVRTGVLAPGEHEVVEVVVTPPPGSPAGHYTLLVAAQSLDPQTGLAGGAIGQADGVVTVGDPSHLAVELDPAEPSGISGRRVSVHLSNRGTEPLDVELSATAARGLRVVLRRPKVALPPGATARVKARLDVDRHWVGQNRRLPFILTAHGRTTPVRLDGVFVARPLLNSTATRLVALLGIIAVWATVGLFAINAISRHAHQKQVADLAAAPQGEQPTKASGSGAGAGGAGGGKSTKAGGSSATRLNGTVTGEAPGRVRVTMTPTTLSDQQPPSTQFFNAAYEEGPVGKISSTMVALNRPLARAASRTTTTAKDGSFAFAGVKAPGYYLVTLSKRGYQTKSFVISAVPGKPLPTLKVPLVAGRGSLSGRVLTSAGRPLPAAAHVTVTGGPLTLDTTTSTVGDVGHWSMTGLSTPGTYVVSAAADGYGAQTAVVHLDATGTATQDLTMHRGVESLAGHVTFGNGQPLGGARVSVTDGTTTRAATTLTDGDAGLYSLPNLPLGTYTVTVAAGGFATQTFRARLDGKASSLDEPAAMTSSTAQISGTVIDASTNDAVDTAGLILGGDAGTYKVVSLATTGGFTFDGVAPGDYVLTVEAFGYRAQFQNVTVHAGDVVTMAPIDLTPDGSGGVPSTSSISGHVVDAHTGAALRCPPSYPTSQCFIRVDIKAPNGETTVERVAAGFDQPYRIPKAGDTHYPDGLPPGLYKLTFSFPGYENSTLTVAVPEATALTAVPVALIPDGTVVGHVTSTASDLTGCIIAVPFDPANPSRPTSPGSSNCGTQPAPLPAGSTDLIPCSSNPGVCIGALDSNGDYEISFIPHGTYWVYIRPEVAGGSHRLDPRFVSLSPVQLTVEAGQSRRYDATLNQFAAVDVLVQEPNSVGDAATVGQGIDVVLTNTKNGTQLPAAATQGDGKAHFATVPAGTYTAHAEDMRGSTTLVGTSDPFQVGVNETVTVPLVLNSGVGTIVGQVYSLVDNVEHDVPGAKVQVTGVVGYSGSAAIHKTFVLTTDATGCFAIGPAAPSTLPAGCSALSGTAFATGDFVVLPDKVSVDTTNDAGYDRYGTQSVQNLTFKTGGQVTGVVVTPPATPVQGQVVLNPAVNGQTTDKVSLLATQLAPGAGNVVLSSTDNTPSGSTDATGTLEWNDASLPGQVHFAMPGAYQVRGSLDGYDPATTSTFNVPLITDSTALATFSVPQITLHARGALSFHALDGTTPVLGATYTLKSASSPPTIPASTVTVAPDAAEATFPNLSPGAGPYDVEVRAAGYAVTTSAATAVVPGATTDVNVQLTQWGRLVGTVSANLGDGHLFPLAGATVRAHNTTGATTATFTTVTDSLGDYTLTGTASHPGLDPSLTWSIEVSAFGYGTQNDTGRTVVAGDNSTGFDYTLVATPITDTVLTVQQNGTSTGVPNAVVQLQNPSVSSSTFSCTTDGTGVCTIHDLPPTTYSMTVYAPSYAPLITTLTLRVGVATQNFFIPLASRTNTIGGSVSGRKLDGSTQTSWSSTDNLSVTLTASGTTYNPTLDLTNGSFSFTGLGDGSYRLDVSANGYNSFSQTISVSNGQVAFVSVVLQPRSFQLTVSVASSLAGVSMSGATVALEAVSGGTGVSQSAQPATPLSHNGAAQTTFNQVAPGVYDVVVVGPAGHTDTTEQHDYSNPAAQESLTVTLHEAEINLTLSSTHDASTSSPTADVTVTNTATAATAYTGTVPTDGTTTHIFVAAPTTGTTTYSLSATLTGSPSGWQTPTYSTTVDAADGTVYAKAFTFVQMASLTVTVLNSAGLPVAGAMITLTPSGAGSTPISSTAGTAADGTYTFRGLTPGTRYSTVVATYTVISGSPSTTTTYTGTARNVTVQSGANSVTITVT